MEAITYYLVLKTGTGLSRNDEILRCSVFVQTFWFATGGGLRLLGTSTAMRGIYQFQIRIVRERREGQLKGNEAENH